MNIYTAYFYYGRDRDDWTSRQFADHDLTSALEKGAAMTPYGYTFWKVEHTDPEQDRQLSFNKYLNNGK